MTQQECLDKCEEMLPNLLDTARKQMQHLLTSGTLDYEELPNTDYSLAKLLMVASIRYAAEQYTPLPRDTRGKRLLNSLRHF